MDHARGAKIGSAIRVAKYAVGYNCNSTGTNQEDTMSGTFTILHLSDAHIGKPDCKYDSGGVLDSLLRDIDTKAKELGKPDLIVFTGDLVHGNPKEYPLSKQYELAKTFLGDVCNNARGQLGNIPLCIVPGNHDVDRSRVDTNQKGQRDKLNVADVQEMMRDQITWKRMLERQETWFDFAKGLSGDDVQWSDCFASHRILRHDDKQIGVVGFNTSWACHEDGEQGKLWIGQHQYDGATEKITECDFTIAASHHPISWLHSDERTRRRDRVQASFRIHLHGHEHSLWFLDSSRHLVVEAGACYEKADKPNSYSWITIDFLDNSARVHLRTYCDRGSGGWGPYFIADKTDEHGIATIQCLFQSSDDGASARPRATTSPEKRTHDPPAKKPDTLSGYIVRLQHDHDFRWEKQSLPDLLGSPIVYWPVKLRLPTPIHAAQAFTAAGLQQYGCAVHLWIDDLGNRECDQTLLIREIKKWFGKGGGTTGDIAIHFFKEVVQPGGDTHAWKMVEKWLSTQHYKAKEVLEISKVVSENGDSEKIVQELSKRRPGRLMTPAMVWACLLELNSTDRGAPIITLGGYDELRLWDAWHQCVEHAEVQLGHLFVSKLQKQKDTFSLAQAGKEFYWTSKHDIRAAFGRSLSNSDEQDPEGAKHQMIPWCLNNCVALPRFVKEAPPLTIGARQVTQLDHFVESASHEHLDDCVEAVSEWLL